MVKAHTQRRILEVACGPGRHSMMLSTAFLQPKGVLVSCDYSNAMVNSLKKNYESEACDFAKVPGNKVVMDIETDYLSFADEQSTTLKNHCDLDAIVAAQGDFRKLVFGC
jgi:ubiquinone/menaquinone biosynthesis C-methylase UbiE